MTAPSCEGCDIVAGRVSTPGGVILEDPFWHVTHIDKPAALLRGMVLVRAKRHVIAIADFTNEELVSLGQVQQLVSRALQRAFAPEKIYSVFFGEGSAHAHFVMIPRYANMPGGNAIKTLSEVVMERKYAIAEEEARQAALMLRDAVEELRRDQCVPMDPPT